MVDVTLVPMTLGELDRFIDEQIADHADEGVLDGSWSRREAPGRSRLALRNVIGWERQAVTDTHQRLWTAVDAGGRCLGWHWVKLAPFVTTYRRAFLCQLTVARAFRGQGYGREMLAALERQLGSEGVAELELNVCEANLSAKRLYAHAGFELATQFPTMRQLRKHLNRASLPTATETTLLASPSPR